MTKNAEEVSLRIQSMIWRLIDLGATIELGIQKSSNLSDDKKKAKYMPSSQSTEFVRSLEAAFNLYMADFRREQMKALAAAIKPLLVNIYRRHKERRTRLRQKIASTKKARNRVQDPTKKDKKKAKIRELESKKADVMQCLEDELRALMSSEELDLPKTIFTNSGDEQSLFALLTMDWEHKVSPKKDAKIRLGRLAGYEATDPSSYQKGIDAKHRDGHPAFVRAVAGAGTGTTGAVRYVFETLLGVTDDVEAVLQPAVDHDKKARIEQVHERRKKLLKDDLTEEKADEHIRWRTQKIEDETLLTWLVGVWTSHRIKREQGN